MFERITSHIQLMLYIYGEETNPNLWVVTKIITYNFAKGKRIIL